VIGSPDRVDSGGFRRRRGVRYHRRVRAAAILLIVAGCARDEAAPICADVAVGDLVITEIHDDHGPAWVELYNASGRPVDLAGTRVLFKRTDGTREVDTLIRRSLVVAPAAYAVLGDATDDARPAYVDYGFAGDWHDAGWLDSAAIDVEVCGARIDRVIYSGLPTPGTLALGVSPPTAEANDLPARWCADRIGSPREANPPCP
jgi:hypothetical protein